MSHDELLHCNISEIFRIVENPQNYFNLETEYEIRELGTNITILLNDNEYNHNSIINLLSNFICHRYLSLKVYIDNEMREYTLGLGLDNDRIYQNNDDRFNIPQIYIPDWSTYSIYSNNTPKLTKILIRDDKKYYKGTLLKKGKLDYNQLKLIYYLHHNIGYKHYVSSYENDFLLIELPFLYSNLGYSISNRYKNYILINCINFINYFDKYPDWFYNELITSSPHHPIIGVLPKIEINSSLEWFLEINNGKYQFKSIKHIKHKNLKKLIPNINIENKYSWSWNHFSWSSLLNLEDLLDELINYIDHSENISIKYYNINIIFYSVKNAISILSDKYFWKYYNTDYSTDLEFPEIYNILLNKISYFPIILKCKNIRLNKLENITLNSILEIKEYLNIINDTYYISNTNFQWSPFNLVKDKFISWI